MQHDFAGRIALVTGAASGIGEAVVRQLAAGGAQVLAADIDGNAATAVAMALGERVQALQVDVSDPDAVRHMVTACKDRFGGLHLAVNNAGISGASLQTADYPLEEWHRVLGVNLHGVFYSMKYEIPAILASGGGAVVNMASILGTNGWAGAAAYVAAKHALVGRPRVRRWNTPRAACGSMPWARASSTRRCCRAWTTAPTPGWWRCTRPGGWARPRRLQH